MPSHSPYAGWMWGHHYAGLVFGVTTLTWIFSGLLSMDPWDWHPSTSPTAFQRLAFAGERTGRDDVDLDTLTRALGQAGRAHEAAVVQSQGQQWLATDTGIVPLDQGTARLPLDADSVKPLASAALPTSAVKNITILDSYDAYYYDRAGALPLPVVRIQYGDPARTWLYVDATRGVIVRKEERLTRLNRWLYHGLHSLDFPFLYYRRPLWDAVVIALSLGGLALTLTTLAPAWRRGRRHLRRLRG